jgi:hypothetical protein
MTNDNIIGVVLGSLLCAVVIAGNLIRAEPHLVSVYPDVASSAVAPLVIYVAGRRRRLSGESSEAVQAFGVRVGAIAGAVFAVGLGAFTLYWLAAWTLWAFAIGAAFTFGSVFVLSCFSAYTAAHKRIIAV